MKINHRPDYMNPEVVEESRLPPRAFFLPSQTTLLLSGRWNFHLADSPLVTPPDSKDPSVWKQIDVPGHWELQDFGRPQYTNFDYPFPADPPNIPSENPTGYYATRFAVPQTWNQKETWSFRLRFEGVESAFRVFLNGWEIGYSQGRSNAAEFDINSYIKADESNDLRVVVYKWSANSYLMDQDEWWLSGIFRDVYLLAFPKVAHIRDFFVKTSFDDDLKNALLETDVTYEFGDDLATDVAVSLKLLDPKGKEVVSAPSTTLNPQRTKTTHKIQVTSPLKWDAETPWLYKIVLTLSLEGHEIQVVEQQVGFRTVEVSSGQLRVNGVPIEIRGVNRHDHHPRFGRAVPLDFIKKDLITMKRHNVNSLRTSHYPNDPRLLILANELGLYVMDEADLECHGMGIDFGRLPSADPVWKGAYVDRMQNLVHRDKNQPCVIMWSLGNESWYGENHQAMYEWSKKFDVTRPIHYENDHEFRASDVESYMYTGFDQLAELAERDGDNYEKPILLCEYLHAMGNGPGSAKEYMELFRKHRRLQGGFVWEWANHGLLKKIDEKSERSFYAYGGDFGDEPNDGNFVMDGLCNSEHNPGPGLLELKQAYQPIAFSMQPSADDASHNLYIENLFDFQDLGVTECVATVLSCDQSGREIVRESECKKLHGIGPGDTRLIMAARPSRWTSAADYTETWIRISVRLTVTNNWAPSGHELARADFCLPSSQPVSRLGPIRRLDLTKLEYLGRIMRISTASTLLDFDKILGRIVHWSYRGHDITQNSSGPRLTFWRGPSDNDKGGQLGEWKGHRVHEMRSQVRSVTHEISKKTGALEITVESYEAPPVLAWGFLTTTKYTIHSDGKLRIHVRACPRGSAPVTLPRVGLEMELPGDDLTHCQWFGLGPGQTYKDMKEAGQLGVWDRSLDKMIYMYEMPQENGNRTETRWARVVNERGFGVKAVLECNEFQQADTRRDDNPKSRGFGFSVSRYTAHELEKAQHPHELPSSRGVVFRVDADHHGVGSAACGPDVMEKYKLVTRVFDFTVSLEPVNDQIDLS